MGWFPNNNHPSDKAMFDFHLTAPNAYDAIGNGEFGSKVVNGDKTTCNWHMGYPMASYLSTSTIGSSTTPSAPAHGGRQRAAAAQVLRLHRERAPPGPR